MVWRPQSQLRCAGTVAACFKDHRFSVVANFGICRFCASLELYDYFGDKVFFFCFKHFLYYYVLSGLFNVNRR